MTPAVEEKLSHLKSVLREMRTLVVAYSGGVDSSLLLRVAADTSGIDLVAVTTDSPTSAPEETRDARKLAVDLQVRHLVLGVNELDTPGYAENPANRCYLCKQTLYPLCRDIALKEEFAYVVDGINTDDLGDYRPGLDAAQEHGVRHPFVETGLSKAEIREISRSYGLETADKPASPCLSSRFPYGVSIDEDRLHQVAVSEAFMRRLGFRELRVRHLGNRARVEVAESELGRLADPALSRRIVDQLGEYGFESIELSKVPLRSGSLNDVLTLHERERV